MYETKDKLPVGSMFVARKGDEIGLLKLAKQIEAAGYLKTNIIHI